MFPQNIAKLFSLTTKADVEEYARQLVLDRTDLFGAMKFAKLGGYLHLRGRHEWPAKFTEESPKWTERMAPIYREVAPEWSLFNDEWPTFTEDGSNMLARLFNGVNKELYAHFFIKPDIWHLFYLTYGDRSQRESNRWENGIYLHFINHLWPNYKLEEMEDRLIREQRTTIGNSLHIKVK